MHHALLGFSLPLATYLADQGFSVLYNLQTGMMGWSGPVERPS